MCALPDPLSDARQSYKAHNTRYTCKIKILSGKNEGIWKASVIPDRSRNISFAVRQRFPLLQDAWNPFTHCKSYLFKEIADAQASARDLPPTAVVLKYSFIYSLHNCCIAERYKMPDKSISRPMKYVHCYKERLFTFFGIYAILLSVSCI